MLWSRGGQHFLSSWISNKGLSLPPPQVWLLCPAPAWASSWAATSSRSSSWELASQPSWLWSAAESPCSASPHCSSWAAKASTWEESTSPTPPGEEGNWEGWNSGKVVGCHASVLMRKNHVSVCFPPDLNRTHSCCVSRGLRAVSTVMWLWRTEDKGEKEGRDTEVTDKHTVREQLKTPTEKNTELWKRLTERGEVERISLRWFYSLSVSVRAVIPLNTILSGPGVSNLFCRSPWCPNTQTGTT